MEVLTRKLCCTGLEGPVDLKAATRVAEDLKALSDPSRVAIVRILAAAGGEVCVCDLEEHLQLSQPTVSHHLRVLTEAGVLERRQRGRWAFFSLRQDRLTELADQVQSLGA